MIDRRTLLGASAVGLGLGLAPRALAAPKQALWVFDSLKRIGGAPATVEGAPRVVASPWGKAVQFDGIDDALFVRHHPLAGAPRFTFEAYFRPDGGAFEQRWFHLESDQVPAVEPGKGNTRMLFEIRVVENQWYLDTFITGAGYRQTLIVEDKRFPVGRWYHVAQTHDGKTYRAFVDGVEQMAVEMPFAPQGPGQTSVGVRLNRLNYFNGAVARARFTHEALAPAQFLRPPPR